MSIKKMQGASIQAAVKKATLLYGEEISIVETKTIKGSGLFGKSKTYEVTISVPDNLDDWESNSNRKSRFQNQIERQTKNSFDLKIDTTENYKDEDLNIEDSYLIPETSSNKQRGGNPYQTTQIDNQNKKEHKINISENARKIAEIAKRRQEEIHPNRDVPKKNIQKKIKKQQPIQITGETQVFHDIKTEMNQLNDKIKLIQNMFWEEKGPDTTIIPPEFAEIYKIAKESGMNREHLDMIMKLSIEHMPFKMRQNSETVKRYFTALLRKMIPIRTETLIKPPNQKIFMLVGSTGVGKTTTIAKLTARFALKSDIEYKVGLLVLDTYKIGAVEQLSQYARMMKVEIDTVISPKDFADKLEQMSHKDYIFIDTMGSSPYDLEKIESIKEFLESGKYSKDIEVMLVLPSSLKYEDLKEGYNSFSKLNIDTIMFTKLDETKGFGNIFSLIHDIQKPISYFSIGQEVPEDIIVAKSDYLVESLLHGFKRERVDDNF